MLQYFHGIHICYGSYWLLFRLSSNCVVKIENYLVCSFTNSVDSEL